MRVKTRKVQRTVLNEDEQEYCCDRLMTAVNCRLLTFRTTADGVDLEISFDQQQVMINRRSMRDPEVRFCEYCPYCGQKITF